MARNGPDLSRVASLIGDPGRASMLSALLGGVALTASELAREAGVTAQTASSHLAKLEAGRLVRVRKQGRHRYFALASDEVAATLESLSSLAGEAPHRRTRPGPRDEAMRRARVCYDHLAGDMGVRLYDSLIAQGALDGSAGLSLTPRGSALLTDFGVDVAALSRQRSALVRECLDWSERRSHLGGAAGRALFARFAQLHWLRREEGSRTVRFTPEGERAFREMFPLPLADG